MKFIRYLTYLLYSYYLSSAGRNSAYLRSILAITFTVFLNVLALIALLDLKYLFTMPDRYGKGGKYLILAAVLSPVFVFFYVFIKEQKLLVLKRAIEKANASPTATHRAVFIGYIAASFFIMGLASLYKR